MKIPSNRFTYNLVFFLILCFIILSYIVFFRYKEGATYSVKTYTSTPTIVPPACNLMTNDRCSQNSGFCMWDSLTSGCLNKLDCANLNQTTCSKQNYCTWKSSINKCSVKT
jgi:hypothetical protein